MAHIYGGLMATLQTWTEDHGVLALSKKRAQTVAKWMISKNYAPASYVETYGAGEREPVASNKTAEGRELNGRVEAIAIRKKYWDG